MYKIFTKKTENVRCVAIVITIENVFEDELKTTLFLTLNRKILWPPFKEIGQ